MHRWFVGIAGAIGIVAVSAACGSDTACESAECAGPVVGNPEGGDVGDAPNPVDATPPGCDPTKEQKDQEACLNDEFAIFVSLLGKPDNLGTRTAPVNTVERALRLVGGNKQRIYVCEGTYSERVALKAAISIYGGLSCTGNQWTSQGAAAVFTTPQQPGYALDITRAAGVFELVDLEFVAAPGTVASPNSVAARVIGSPGLLLRRVALTSAAGAEGAPGDSGEPGVRAPADGKGISGTQTAAGGPKACTCTVGGPTAGGGGGGPDNGGGKPGTGDAPGTAPNDGLGGAGAITNCVGGTGHQGGAAPDEAPAVAQTRLGLITNEAWAANSGVDGSNGGSGQGGGGGGANAGGGGGGGGCGGCGGSGGKAGKGGGASIGLLTIDSPVKLVASSITTAAAGNGGKAGTGAGGSPIGFAGTAGSGGPGADGCAGGQGGAGGAGGHGSGGPGGVAIGILHQGSAPTRDAATAIKQNGTPALGGEPVAAGANAGPQGKQMAVGDAASL